MRHATPIWVLMAAIPVAACSDTVRERAGLLPRGPTAQLTYAPDRRHEPGRGELRCLVRDDNGDLAEAALGGPRVDLRRTVDGRTDTVTVAVDSLAAGRHIWVCTVRDERGHTAVGRVEVAVDSNRSPTSRLRVIRRDGTWRVTQTAVTDPDGDSVRYTVRVAGPAAHTIGPRDAPIDTTLALPPGRYAILGIASDGVAADTARRTIASGPAPMITQVAGRRGTVLTYTATVIADRAALAVVRIPADTIYRGPVPADTTFTGMTAGDTLGLLKGIYRFTLDATRSAQTGGSVIEATIPNLDPTTDLSAIDATVRAGARIVIPLPPPRDLNREDHPAYRDAVPLDGNVGVTLEAAALAITADTGSAGPYRVALTIGDSTTGSVVATLSGMIVPRDTSQDTTAFKSGYDDVAVAGGATSVEADLVNDDRTKRPLLDVAPLRPALGWYYRLKKRLNDRIGLAVSMDYVALNQFATYSASDRQAASGVFRVFGSWRPFGSRERGSGTLVAKIENRHRIGPGLTPRNLGFEAGSSFSTAGFKDFSWGVTNFYWKQLLPGGRFGLFAGKMDPGDFSDTHPLLTPWKSFMNDAYANNPSVALPNQGLGVVTAGQVVADWYVAGGLHDANGSATEWGFDTFFDVREYYTWVETGWNASRDLMSGSGVHVNAWHQDALTRAAMPESWGVTLSGGKEIAERWTPFFRAGYSEGGAALVRFVVGGGVGLTMRGGGDYLAVATSWSAPPDRSLRSQLTTEALYRLQLTEFLAVTPDLQVTLFPSRTLERDLVAVAGVLRMRLAF